MPRGRRPPTSLCLNTGRVWLLVVRPPGRETIGKHRAVPNPPNGGLAASDRGRWVAPQRGTSNPQPRDSGLSAPPRLVAGRAARGSADWGVFGSPVGQSAEGLLIWEKVMVGGLSSQPSRQFVCGHISQVHRKAGHKHFELRKLLLTQDLVA